MAALSCFCIRTIGTVDGLVAWTIAVRDDECPTVEHRTRVGA